MWKLVLFVLSLSQSAWGSCGLDENGHKDLPAGTHFIPTRAFVDCPIVSITMPASLMRIDQEAFQGCINLTTVLFPGDSNLTSIGPFAFAQSGLTTIDIPSGVTTIPVGFCDSCSSLESVIIRDSVTEINQSAFLNCTALTSVDIPASVTTIGHNAFLNTNIQTVGFAGTRTSPQLVIEPDAFDGCGCTDTSFCDKMESGQNICDCGECDICTSDNTSDDSLSTLEVTLTAVTGALALTTLGFAIATFRMKCTRLYFGDPLM